ncbi:MAG: CubicO group peptidase (beta-lactamase class C family) [Candidatus Azotimanducaceae bacterium]|jgi:CubicO group peptidase (beta-lactamase class C family)
MQIDIQGKATQPFDSVKSSFAQLWQTIEVGASLCVYYQGEKVVDLWGGCTDRDHTIAWQPDTLVNVYSASKGITAFAFAILVDSGKVTFEDLVSTHWPEFGAESKQNITIAQLLSHQGGLCGVETPLEVSDLYDWDKMANLLAAQKPLWEPGTAAAYHAVTWGYLVGELIRRVSGQTIGAFIREKICEPLDADFYLGLPDTELYRYAPLIGPNHMRNKGLSKPKGDRPAIHARLFKLAQMNPPISPFKDACSDAWRKAEIPASNGHSSARGLAKIYAAMANGGKLEDIQICGQRSLDQANRVEVEKQKDLVLGTVIRRSRGFILNTDQNYGPSSSSFGHAGAGGSMAFADPELNLSFAYTMNQMQNDAHLPRSKSLINQVYKCIYG